jgi:hypothetical protein
MAKNRDSRLGHLTAAEIQHVAAVLETTSRLTFEYLPLASALQVALVFHETPQPLADLICQTATTVGVR